jgi:MFS family permease
MVVGNIYLITAVSVIGGGLFGFDIYSMSAIIGTPQYLCYFNQGPPGGKCAGPNPDVQGGITASMAGGSWVGALVSGFLSDILGRKKAIMTGAVIWYDSFSRVGGVWDTDSLQVYWLNHCVRIPEHRNANRRPHHQRL